MDLTDNVLTLSRRNMLKSSFALLPLAAMPACSEQTMTSENTTQTIKPRFVTCCIGEWASFDSLKKIITQFGNGFEFDDQHSALETDDRMERAFDSCWDRVAPSHTNNDEQAVEQHTAVAYFLSPAMMASDSLRVCAQVLELVAKMIAAGATGIKCESSGIAHGLAHWKKMSTQFAGMNQAEQLILMRNTFVKRPISSGQSLYSCGMHLLGAPDILCDGSANEQQKMKLIDSLSEHVLKTVWQTKHVAPERALFKLNAFTFNGISVKAVPDSNYASDDFYHNPYGYCQLKYPS
jgi:hypothetical protein